MKLVALYGPPGVGKLTVARELAALTGYRLLDNHVTIDWARRFFEFATPEFWKLDTRLKFTVIDELISADAGLILTFSRPDRELSKSLDAQVAATGGSCCYVQLVCDLAVLERRLASEERAPAGKLTNVAVLQRMLERNDLLAPVPERQDLIVDNTDLLPAEVAQAIVTHFGLDRRVPESGPKS